MSKKSGTAKALRFRLSSHQRKPYCRNEFRGSKSFVVAYTSRVVVEITISCLYGFWISYAGNGNIYECDVTRGTCTFLKYKECVKDGVRIEEPTPSYGGQT